MTDELTRTPGTTPGLETVAEVLIRRARKVAAAYFETVRDTEALRNAGDFDTAKKIDLDHIMFPLLRALRDAAADLEGAPDKIPGEYTRVTDTSPGYHDGRVTEYHESFAVAQFNRVSGHCGRLFGSPLNDHLGMISLKIQRAQRSRSPFDNANYWPAMGSSADRHGAANRTICEVYMSSAQMAELMTTMNSGSGTPVTLHEVTGTRMEEVPADVKHEAEEIVDDIRSKLDGRAPLACVAAADVILEKKSIGKADRAKLKNLIRAAADGGTKELPFYMRRFTEACEGITASAKAEVSAAANAVIHATGIKALREGMAPVLGPPKKGRTRLPAGARESRARIDPGNGHLPCTGWECTTCVAPSSADDKGRCPQCARTDNRAAPTSTEKEPTDEK